MNDREMLHQSADLVEALRHLRAVVTAYDHADAHIQEKLQPEFRRLGEVRLATWWHGVYDEVDQARAFLKLMGDE